MKLDKMYKNYSELGFEQEKNRDLYDVIDISSKEHKEQLINQNRLLCVDVYADWCGPCKSTSSQYSVLSKQYNNEGDVLLVKEKFDLKLSKNITGLPTYYFILDGKIVDSVIGADLVEVENKLQKHISTIQNTPSSGPSSFNKSSIRNYRQNNNSSY